MSEAMPQYTFTVWCSVKKELYLYVQLLSLDTSEYLPQYCSITVTNTPIAGESSVRISNGKF
jgi:hypothetical protein